MYDGWIMIRYVNMIPLTLMYTMGLTFGLLGAISSEFPPLMSLTDVLMTLLILITRYRDDLDFILIENVTLLNYGLDFRLLKQGLSNLP